MRGANGSTLECTVLPAPSRPNGLPGSANGCVCCPSRCLMAIAGLSHAFPPQPYVRWDTNDYSLDPRLAGRRVEVSVTQRELVAIALDTGELACRHRRSFAKHLTFTDPAHQRELERLRGERRCEVQVEIRPLARYDRLIPA